MVVRSSGNVGVGTADPNAKLDVVAGQFRVKRYPATVSVDWNNGNVQSITLANGVNTITFANGQDGSRYTLILKQPASGAAGTVSWPGTARWSGASPPALTVTNGRTDYVGFIYNGVDSTYDGVAVVLNF
jgi:hypothetical protein